MAGRRLLIAVPILLTQAGRKHSPHMGQAYTATGYMKHSTRAGAGVRRKVLPQWMVAERGGPSPVCQKEFLILHIVTGMLYA